MNFNRKPVTGFQINRSLPLARRLDYALFCESYWTVDRAHNLSPSTIEATAFGSAYGIRGLVHSEGPDSRYISTTPNYLRPARVVTLMWRGVQLGAAGSYIAGCSYTTTDSSPYSAYQIFKNQSGVYGFGNSCGGSYLETSFGVSDTTGRIFTLVGVLDGTNIITYSDGIPYTSVEQPEGDLSYAAGSTIGLGNYPVTGGTSPNCIHDLMYVWPNRALTAKEVISISLQPYQILQPIFRRRVKLSGPTLTDVDPATGNQDTTGLVLTLTGTGFAAA